MINPVKSWRESKNRYQNLGKNGKILSLTKIETPVEGFSGWLPYWVAVIKLKTGEKVTGQLTGQNQAPKPGDKVIGVLRRSQIADKAGVVEYGVKWKIYE